MQSKYDVIALYCKATYPTAIVAVIVVIYVWTEPVPGHNKDPRGFKVFKFASIALHML